jgi:hypothetical protein
MVSPCSPTTPDPGSSPSLTLRVTMYAMRTLILLSLVLLPVPLLAAEPLPWIKLSADKKSFITSPGDKPFHPHGFNYDRDDAGRLIEDYWVKEWKTVEEDFAEMKELGANVVRVHLQFGKFMKSADEPSAEALAQLGKLLKVAETNRLYLDLTGLGCYHKKDIPEWYDKLAEAERWNAQANFWRAVAKACRESPAVFCYDLMNEPVVPGGKRKEGDWLGPPLGDKHFVQVITLDQADRPRPDVAKAWIDKLTAAIREVDDRHLVTVGLVDWSLDRPGLTSGFVPSKCCEQLDFICVHLYPQKGKLDEAIETLKGFDIGKPVVIEETFPMKCSMEEMESFLDRSKQHSAGVISFYWGKTPQELKTSGKLVDAIVRDWLERFGKRKRE